MMSVSEYANDVGKNVKDVLNLCKKLEISVTNEEDMLDDEAIILLDNELDSITDEFDDEISEEELEKIGDSYEEELEEVKVVANVKKKSKQPRQENKKSDYKEKRKEMYKHKEKLQKLRFLLRKRRKMPLH